MKYCIVSLCCLSLLASAQMKPADYVDLCIGNVSQFLVPTSPTVHQPNQMLRMFPVRKNYLSADVQAFPLQVIRHRSTGLLKLRVSLGPQIDIEREVARHSEPVFRRYPTEVIGEAV